jgi:hypothetical protein
MQRWPSEGQFMTEHQEISISRDYKGILIVASPFVPSIDFSS